MRIFSITFVSVLLVFPGCVEDDPAAEIQDHGLAYLLANQNEDGGFPPAPNATSDLSTSQWVALALVAADAPADVRDRLASYLDAHTSVVEANATGSLSRVNPTALHVLALDALGTPAAQANLTKMVARLETWGDNESVHSNELLFLVGALSAAGRAAAVDDHAARIKASLVDPSNNTFTNDSWSASHAILALLAHGESSDDPDLRAATRGLLRFQEEDAGFRYQTEYPADASSTAAVVAVLHEVRFIYSHERTTGLEFIQGLQAPDGHVMFSSDGDFGPVKTTVEAILGAAGTGPFGL